MSNLDREPPSADKGYVSRQLTDVGSVYLHQVIEPGPPISIPSEPLRRKFAAAMELLLFLPEDDRYSVLLRGFCSGLRLREGRTTQSQYDFLHFIETNRMDLLPLPLYYGRNFLDELVNRNNIVKDCTAEASLYVISHHDLGLYLPPHFHEVARKFKEHVLDPQNQEELVDSAGILHLE